jgi:hypothetical protein
MAAEGRRLLQSVRQEAERHSVAAAYTAMNDVMAGLVPAIHGLPLLGRADAVIE